jgi:hypothetical protein
MNVKMAHSVVGAMANTINVFALKLPKHFERTILKKQ